MPIVSSTFVAEHAQTDRRQYIRERHTDDEGAVHEVYYLADVGTDHRTVMLARVSKIEVQIVEVSEAAAQRIIDDSAQARLDAYVAGLSNVDARRLIGYTDDELASVREARV